MCATLSEKTEALETENGRLEKRIEQLLQENAEQSKRVRTKYICLDYHLLKWTLQERYFVTLSLVNIGNFDCRLLLWKMMVFN